eukprot:1391152-Amorphochlora_amoeboformis.AAC.1
MIYAYSEYFCSNINKSCTKPSIDYHNPKIFSELVSSGRGIGIRVLSAGSDKKQPTAASFVLNSVNQVADFLAKIQQLDASPKSQLQGPRAPQAGPVTAPISSEDLMSTKGPNPTLRPTTNSKT